MILLVCLPLVAINAKVNKQVVTLSCNLDCQGCCDKVMKNIAFEKGVKDLVCNLEEKTVTVTYDANKTDVPTIIAAFEKIGKKACLPSEKKEEKKIQKVAFDKKAMENPKSVKDPKQEKARQLEPKQLERRPARTEEKAKEKEVDANTSASQQAQ